MTEDTKKLVQQQFTANAKGYVTSVTHGRGASLGRLVALMQPQAHERALDVATAVGHTALTFAPHLRQVVGLDLTAAMFVPARRLASERNLSNIAWLVGDVEAMPLTSESFEIVVCRIALHHWPNAAQGIREMARVARRGGRVALVDNVVPDDKHLAEFVNHYEQVRDPSHHWCYTLNALTQMFTDAGLRVTTTETLDKATGFDDWVKRMSVPAPTIEDLKMMLRAPEAAATLRPEMRDGLLHFHLAEAIITAMKG